MKEKKIIIAPNATPKAYKDTVRLTPEAAYVVERLKAQCGDMTVRELVSTIIIQAEQFIEIDRSAR